MGNTKYAEILKKGEKEWNEWRAGNPGIEIDLGSANLACADLSGFDLSNARMSLINLSGKDDRDGYVNSYLIGTNLQGADLWGANLNAAVFLNANLDNAILTSANLGFSYSVNDGYQPCLFRGASMINAKLDCAKLNKTDLSGANLTNVNFTNTFLEDTNFSGANLTNANLAGTRLSNLNFSGADLTNADLTKANLTNANLANANLTNANLGGTDSTDGYQPCCLRGANMGNTNLNGAKLINTDLRGADLTGTNLAAAILVNPNLIGANLINANLTGANLANLNLRGVNLTNANLEGADLSGADLTDSILDNANLKGANLTNANLTRANLVETDFSEATITGCKVYGISAWNLKLENTIQKDLVISMDAEPVMTVDNLAVAQFIYLILNNKNIRNILNTITSKGVLILGRFSDPERKAVLDGLREKLRLFDLLPIVFDFDRPTDKDYTETVQTLAGISMFVIADLTSPKSSPLELEATVKHFKIPYIPIIDTSIDPRPFAMLVDLQKSFHWVLQTLGYNGKDQLLKTEVIKKYIIDPVNKKREELRIDKNVQGEMIMITDIV
ncbi:MAG: pentapeptide repeat-containing protein [Chitinophagaceae bacterium]